MKSEVPRAVAAKLIAEEKAGAAAGRSERRCDAEVERKWKHAAD